MFGLFSFLSFVRFTTLVAHVRLEINYEQKNDIEKRAFHLENTVLPTIEPTAAE